MSQEAKSLTSSLGKLQISPKDKASTRSNDIAESWEDEADGDLTPVRPKTSDIPGPPPPTPSSPTAAREQTSHYQSFPPFTFDGSNFDDSKLSPSNNIRGGEDRRPDKTTSVASRLIAAGIGQKAPKRTQEQREYDQAMKVQEKKKRDEAKAEEERKRREKEQAQKDIWGE